MNTQITTQLPIPPHFQREKVSEVWRVPYQQSAVEAQIWAKQHNIKPIRRQNPCLSGFN